MKLTRTDKDAFVSAVIQDIPKIDYEEQYRVLVVEDSIACLPEKVQAIARDKSLKHFISTTTHWHRGNMPTVTVFTGRGGSYTPSSEVAPKLAEIARLHREQEERLNLMRQSLNASISACTTLKMALERLPEFAKYLPEQREKAVHLPAIANLVADLTKMGWPKDKQPAKVAV
jgi:hypothetical protein